MENTQITELVTLKDDGQAVTTSLLIAERFGKQHKDVLKAIKNCDCSEEFSRRNFSPSEYDVRGKKYQMYEITKDGFSFLVLGFTGKQAAQLKEDFINAFNSLLEQAKKQSLPVTELSRTQQILNAMQFLIEDKESLTKQLEQKQEQILLQAHEAAISAPKVEYYDEVLASKNDMTTTVIAKELGHSAIWLNQLLHKLGVIHSVDGVWVLYAKHDGKGYTKTRTYNYVDRNGIVGTSVHTTWSQIGRELIHKLVKQYEESKKSVLPSPSDN